MSYFVSAPIDLFEFPNRADHSVNYSYVENCFSSNPVIKTRTGVGVVNGFNGAGLGSKSILGINVGDNLVLGGLFTLSWNITNMVPYITSPWPLGYANFVLDLTGANTNFALGVIDPQINPALLPGIGTLQPDGSTTWNWQQTAPNYIQFVNSDIVSPANPTPPIPTVTVGAGWQNRAFSIAAITTAYPSARLRRRSTLDGGMPRQTVTNPFMIVQGDSANNREIISKLGPITFNSVFV